MRALKRDGQARATVVKWLPQGNHKGLPLPYTGMAHPYDAAFKFTPMGMKVYSELTK